MELWLERKEVCPEILYRDVMNMPITERVALLLGGSGQFTPEWFPLHSAIVKYIHTLYISRIKAGQICNDVILDVDYVQVYIILSICI